MGKRIYVSRRWEPIIFACAGIGLGMVAVAVGVGIGLWWGGCGGARDAGALALVAVERGSDPRAACSDADRVAAAGGAPA